MLAAGCTNLTGFGTDKTASDITASTGAGSTLEKFDKVITADTKAERLPGAVFLVYRDGKVMHEKAIGLREPDKPAPMTTDSIFRIYSMSKPIVSVGLMMLVEEGKVQLDAPISRYLPEFENVKLGVEKKGTFGNPLLEIVPSPRQPTVLDLMRHTSGMTYGVFGKSLVKTEYLKAGVANADRSNNDYAKLLATMPLAYAPGTVWEYGRSTDIVGSLIERVTGQTLGNYLQQRILGPLGMKDTGFSVATEKHNRIADAYKIDPDGRWAVPMLPVTTPPVFESSGGGMVSTAPDYLRFCRMLLNGGELDGVRILKPETVTSMMTDHLGEAVIRASSVPGANTAYLPGPGYGFGLGFAVRVAAGEPGTSSIGESYWWGWGGTAFWIDPKEKLIGIWMMQAPGKSAHYRTMFKKAVYGALQD
jgi:CubicO group peptidase (beta-lactamase class C family)